MDDLFAIFHIKIRVEFVPFMAFRKLGEMVLPLGVGEKIFMVKPPLARRAYLVGHRHYHPNHRHAFFPTGRGDPVDVRHDRNRRIHFCDIEILHVDDQKGGLCGLEPVEDFQFAPFGHNPFDHVVGYFYVVRHASPMDLFLVFAVVILSAHYAPTSEHLQFICRDTAYR